MTQTIKKWLETLPEPYRARALKNADVEDLENEFDSLGMALQEAFHWHRSPEGAPFWGQVLAWIEWQEHLPSLPPIPNEP